MNLNILAKYPFLEETSRYIKEQGYSLDELLESRVFDGVRARGKVRVQDALYKGEIKDSSLTTETECIKEILSYIVARIIVSCVGEDYLIKRYAIAESKKVSRHLENESDEFIIEVAKELGLNVTGKIEIDFIDYVKYASGFKSREWRLVNQSIERGKVEMSGRRLARLIEEVLRRKIESELPLPVNDEILNAFREDATELRNAVKMKRKSFEPKEFGEVSITKLPPCMKHIIGMIQNNENVPHMGRFALTTFLHALGMSNEEILSIFKATPDFDESKARYQIEHITGQISGTEYTTPECKTMKSFGICYNEDELCKRDWMNHPLTYYRVKSRRPST